MKISSFLENVYGCEKMSVKNDVTHFFKNMAAIADCSKLLMCSKMLNIAASCVRFTQNVNG